MPDITIDGTSVSGITIDGTQVQEVTIDGSVAWTRTSVIDDFEDGDISEYQGDTGVYSVVSSPVQNGSNALEVSSGGGDHIIASTSGLNAYPSAGDEFEVWMRTAANGGDSWIQTNYAVQDAANPLADAYVLVIDRVDGELSYGQSGAAQNEPVSWADNTWYRFNVQWGSGGSQTITVDDESEAQVTQVSFSDASYSSGGVAYRYALGSSGNVAHWDYFHKV